MEDGGIESLLQSERNVQGNSTYFSNGVEDGGDRIPGGYSIGGESGMSGSGSGTGDEKLFKCADELQKMESSFEEISICSECCSYSMSRIMKMIIQNQESENSS